MPPRVKTNAFPGVSTTIIKVVRRCQIESQIHWSVALQYAFQRRMAIEIVLTTLCDLSGCQVTLRILALEGVVH